MSITGENMQQGIGVEMLQHGTLNQQQPSHNTQHGWQPTNASISYSGDEDLHPQQPQHIFHTVYQPMSAGLSGLEDGIVPQGHYLHNFQVLMQPTTVESAIGDHRQPSNNCHIGLQVPMIVEEGSVQHQQAYGCLLGEIGSQQQRPHNFHFGWQPMVVNGSAHHQQTPNIVQGSEFSEEHVEYNNLGLPPHGQSEYSITIRHEATHRMRQYWAMMKQKSRQRKREDNASSLSTAEDMNTVCTTMVKCWQEATKGMNCEAKKATLRLLLEQPAIRRLHHGSEKSILSNIQGTVTKVKASLSEEELKLKRALCMMLVNSEGVPSRSISNSEMARFTGLHRRNFAAANSRLKQAEAGSFPLHLCRRHKPQSRCITQEIKDTVFAFWQTETRVSPNKKDVCRQRVGRKAHIKHPVHLLDESQVCSKKLFNYIVLLHAIVRVACGVIGSFKTSSKGNGLSCFT